MCVAPTAGAPNVDSLRGDLDYRRGRGEDKEEFAELTKRGRRLKRAAEQQRTRRMMEGQKEEGGRKEEAGGGGRRRRTGRGTSIPPAPTHPPTHLPAHSSTPPRLQDRIRISATPFPIPAACFPFPHHLPLPRRLLSFSPSPAISRTTTVRAPTCARWRTRSCVAQTRHLADFALIVASGRKHGRGARPPFAFRDGARLGPHSAEHRDRRRVLSLPQRPAFQSGRLRGGHVLGAAVFVECPVAEGRPRGRQAVPIFQRAPEGA